MSYRARSTLASHSVSNQPPALAGVNLYTSDAALTAAQRRYGAGWASEHLAEYGAICGDELMTIGFEANDNPPALRAFDPGGRRIDEVVFHPAYHRSMALAKRHGLHSLTWTDERAGAQVARSALVFLHNQVEAGAMCPITMTHAAVAALSHAPALAKRWLPRVLANEYDPASRPPGDKAGLTIGMGMTEKQGGSDVRGNTTRAAAQADGVFSLRGHKWFFSAPMSDAFLVLAQCPAGLSCFWLPRWRADGQRNAIEIQRLKSKLGDRANASSEVEFADAEAYRVGEPGRGVATIIDMVAQTRLDCALGSAGQMRQALVQAIHHCRHRQAFGAQLVDQPLMTRVLADMALESEAATALALRLAAAFGAAHSDPHARDLARIATPVTKYFVCKSAPPLINEAQECLGGNGYVEESILPRLFRQSPVNSIWEGAGNVQCLDVLRAAQKTPAAVDALIAELDAARGLLPAFDAYRDVLVDDLAAAWTRPERARLTTERIARALQAAILLTAEADWVGAAFCQTRLVPDARGGGYGSSAGASNDRRLVERAFADDARADPETAAD